MVNEASPAGERAMIEAALRDRNAYADVVRRYEPMIARYVGRLLGPRAQSAEDVLQEIFIKAYVNLNDYDRARPFAPWLYRIAHNEAVSFLRKHDADRHIVNGKDALLILERVADGEDPATLWHRRRTAEDVRQAIGELDGRSRDVLTLRYLEEKSYDQIADILEMPPGTVATLIARGMKRLRGTLRGAWGET
jgi:RNA polymerase sigma-70 factor (ECF subfamily)